MTGLFGLDWANLALSLANTILLMWLGTTVLLNTERRTWGGWLAAAGLLLGGVFFISHTAILGYGFKAIGVGINLWWAVGLMAVTILPFLWYVMMLWYSGFWQRTADGTKNQLVQRHRLFLLLAGVMLIGLLLVALAARNNPISGGYPARGLEESVLINGQPLVLVVYPVYVLVCLVFALDALYHPGLSHRLMGELARKRAQPWLVGATLALLLVSLAVGGVFAWLFQFLGNFDNLANEIISIAWFDLLIEFLILLAVILLGQAVVAYEIFTGQALPRQGFMRQWQRAILLALGYGAVIGFTFSTSLRPIYGVMLSALLMTFFFAMLSWRTVSERQRAISSLRPFVISQRFYDQLMAPSNQIEPDPGQQTPFDALCRDVLNTRLAFLIALGPLAPLAGRPLCFPALPANGTTIVPDQGFLSELLSHFTPDESIIKVADNSLPGIEWAVPLWSQRGLAGVLMLGNKQDGGIYSREEIEVAQAIGERLIDTKASTEIARRLMSLQRQRLAETQVMDQRARRVLHDEVLQQLHAAMLKLDTIGSRSSVETEEAIAMLGDVHAQISALLRTMPGISIQQISSSGLIDALHRLVAEEMSNAFESVSWKIPPELEQKAAEISRLEAEVLYYASREAIRNAALHARSHEAEQPLNLTVEIRPENRLTVVIEDDGIGIKSQKARAFHSGQGLALHGTMMAVVGGEMDIESEPGSFTRVILRLP